MRTSVRSLVFSPHPIRTLSFAVPLALLFVAAGRDADGGWAAPITAGVLWWTFAEYAFHRWLYHLRPRWRPARSLFDAIHLQHHRQIADRRLWNAGPLLAIPIAVILAGPVLAVTRDPAVTSRVLLGTVVAYFVYEWAHYAAHAREWRSGPLAYLQGFHLHHHHGNARECFGVTNPLWDLLFGTAAPRSRWVRR